MSKSKLMDNLYKANDELVVLRAKMAVMENEHTKLRSLAGHWEKRHELLSSKLDGYREVLEIMFK